MAAIKEILLVPHTHHDIGYTHIPEVCLRMHERYIHEALRLCEADLLDESPAAFRWTIETSLPLLNYLRKASEVDVHRLQRLVQRGRIAVTAAYAHMTQLIGAEEYIRYFYPLRALREQYHLPVSVLQHGDINGLSWGSVPLMREAGLDSLVMALNPDHGRAPFEQPSAFYWEGQDGSRVLVWLNLFYSLANNPWALTAGRIDAAQAPIRTLVERLEARDDYPFDFVIVHSAEDNMLPNNKLSSAVRQWNAAGLEPPLRIVTIDQALERTRVQAHPDLLPTVRGEWADWWANGHGSSAYEVAVSRIARSELRVAETADVLGQLSGAVAHEAILPGFLPITNWYRSGNTPSAREDRLPRIDAAYHDLLLFEEHTWGTFETITLPFSLFTQTHWNSKAGQAFRALTEAHDLSREALLILASTLPLAEQPALVVFNPLSTPRDELITVRTPGIDHSVFVRDLPPLGIKVIAWDMPAFDALEELALPADQVIENDYYRLRFDPAHGTVISLIDKQTGKEWVDLEASNGLGAVIYEEADPSDDHPAIHVRRNHFHPDTPGPRFIRISGQGEGKVSLQRAHYGLLLTMYTSAPYLPAIRTTIRLYDAVKWLDFSIQIDKHENYEMEGVYVAFPFALHDPSFWLQTANAVYRADLEQLPDTCRDWYSIQHGIGISDGESSVLWATREAPLVQLAEIQTGKWLRTLDAKRGHLYAWLMNNLYFTNFKAAQGGRTEFNFRLTTQAGNLTTEHVQQWGDAFGTPPLARIAPLEHGDYQWLTVEPFTVVVQSMQNSLRDPDAFTLRLKEMSGQSAEVTITWKQAGNISIAKTDFLELETLIPLEEVESGHQFKVRIEGYQLLTLMLKVQRVF
ncbi:MAG: hypothetical protein KF726_07115 [Anaerolineae bacterium]|nr:hypothetical protein [Anaerolineae bacterium]